MKLSFQKPLSLIVTASDKLSFRERILVICACLSLIYAMNVFAIVPLFVKSQKKLTAEIALKEQEVKALGLDVQRLVSMREKSSDPANRARLIALQEQIREMQRVPTLLTQLVAPTDMAQLVENLLANNRQVELLHMENIEPELMNPPPQEEGAESQPVAQGSRQGGTQPIQAQSEAEKTNKDSNAIRLYKHGMSIEVMGRYWDIVRLLKTIEGQPRKILWGQVNLVTDKYPFSVASITIYTVNLEPSWITI